MTQGSPADEVVFNTKWFQIVTRQVAGSTDPHYLINCTDFVAVVAVNQRGQLLLVRQLRPAISGLSLEVPSGHVEIDETPEQAARKELLEETGHVADKFELLMTMSPGIGRFTNRMWCYFAGDALPTPDTSYQTEAGIDLVLYEGTLQALAAEKGFLSSLSYSTLFAAVLRGKLKI